MSAPHEHGSILFVLGQWHVQLEVCATGLMVCW